MSDNDLVEAYLKLNDTVIMVKLDANAELERDGSYSYHPTIYSAYEVPMIPANTTVVEVFTLRNRQAMLMAEFLETNGMSTDEAIELLQNLKEAQYGC